MVWGVGCGSGLWIANASVSKKSKNLLMPPESDPSRDPRSLPDTVGTPQLMVDLSSGRSATRHHCEKLADAFGDRPFTFADVCELGISRGQLRAMHNRGYLTRMHQGLYVVTSPSSLTPLSDAARARQALMPFRDVETVVTGPLAAALHGLPLVRPPTSTPLRDSIEVMVLESQGSRCGYRTGDAVVRRVREFPPDTEVLEGIRVTSPLHCAIDAVRMGSRTRLRSRARSLFLPESLVILDAATARLGARDSQAAQDLIAHMRPRFRYGPGIRSIDAVAELVEPRSESPLESWSRGYMVVFAVPPPTLQAELTGADGFTYRVDFWWERFGVIGEADGRGKYGDTLEQVREAKRREAQRQRALEATGLVVVRWTWEEIATDPKAVMNRINQALRSRQSSGVAHKIA